MAVLAVRCISVSESDAPIEQAIFNEKDEIIGYEEVVERSYYASFALEAVVCRLAAYDVLPEAKRLQLAPPCLPRMGRRPSQREKPICFSVHMRDRGRYETIRPRKGEPRWEFPYPGEHVLAVDDQNDSGILSQYDGVSGNMLFSWREGRGRSAYLALPDRRFLAVLCRI